MIDIKLGTVSNAQLAGKLITGSWVERSELLSVGMAILKKHKFTCQGCGFASRSSKQVPHGWMIPVDPLHPGLLAITESRGTCLCPLCASSIAINWSVCGRVVSGKELPAPGLLVMLPHMSQVELNRLALHLVSIHASRKVSQQNSLEAIAINVDSVITSRAKDLQGTLPIYRDGRDSEFARALSMLPDEFYKQRDEIIGPVRWWPSMSYWRDQGLYWMKSTYQNLQDNCSDLVEAINL